VKPVELTEDD
jgi:magnesium-transporting ATPase (P-type)